ncbi:unnamed protein product [Pleuronectes platessa]|uniref:Uncharacterized protein n=1 Tax=Pleuronectes platessa TaxID=8262 RepID=A0A9N7V2W1_PLEPL|nr:unnamed protein product [Pleuronectes platessa]
MSEKELNKKQEVTRILGTRMMRLNADVESCARVIHDPKKLKIGSGPNAADECIAANLPEKQRPPPARRTIGQARVCSPSTDAPQLYIRSMIA